MPLPEKVVEQLGKEPSQVPGWSAGLISFSLGIFLITVIIWAGLSFGYKPYLESQTAKIQDQINEENQAISPSDQANVINFYSQISNLQGLLESHTIPTNVLAWLQANTEQNVYYTSMSLTQSGQLALSANALTEADANQQIAIFENSPQVQNLNVSGVTLPSGNSFWGFSVSLQLDPSIISSSTPSSQ